jgi:hypothetical protein
VKMTVFWDAAVVSCKLTDVSEVLTASIIRAIIFKKLVVCIVLDQIKQRFMAGVYEHSTKHSDSIKGGKFFEAKLLLLLLQFIVCYCAYCTHRLVVVPEYVRWRFRTVQNNTREVDGAAAVNVQVWTTNDVGSWLCKQISTSITHSSKYTNSI